MEIVSIVDGALYSILWSPNEEHALDEMAIKLMDVEYLSSFFENQKEKLNYFKVNTLKAVHKTIHETDEIIQELSKLASNSVTNHQTDLDSLFEPLHKNEAFQHPRYHTDFKAKGYQNEAPWIRIYAVRCDKNFFCHNRFRDKASKTNER